MTSKISMRCPMDVSAAHQSKGSRYYDIRGDLINTLDSLLSKKHLDFVLVELNGLADPSQIIHTFWVNEGMGSLIELH